MFMSRLCLFVFSLLCVRAAVAVAPCTTEAVRHLCDGIKHGIRNCSTFWSDELLGVDHCYSHCDRISEMIQADTDGLICERLTCSSWWIFSGDDCNQDPEALFLSQAQRPGVCTKEIMHAMCLLLESGEMEPNCHILHARAKRRVSKVAGVEEIMPCLGKECEEVVDLIRTNSRLRRPFSVCPKYSDNPNNIVAIPSSSPLLFDSTPLFTSDNVADFPSNIVLRTPRATFTHEYYALIGQRGRIWYRPRPNGSVWKLLSLDGLPKPPALESDLADFESSRELARADFIAPHRIVFIDADADTLLCIGEYEKEGSTVQQIYYMKWEGMIWQGKWGLTNALPLIPVSFLLHTPLGPPDWPRPLDTDLANFAASHRENFNVYADDTAGHRFRQQIGVVTLFAVNNEGTSIRYIDPWLPVDWGSSFCGPLRNTIRMKSFAAAGSVQVVLDSEGFVWSRFGDYDTDGHNPTYVYSYDCWNSSQWDGDSQLTNCKYPERFYAQRLAPRALPPFNWIKHESRPDGDFTRNLTVLVTGRGADRQLRLLGKRNGSLGYYFKDLNPTSRWDFCGNGMGGVDSMNLTACLKYQLTPELIDMNRQQWVDKDSPLETIPSADSCYKQEAGGVEITAINFNAICSPTLLSIKLNKRSIEYTATLHFARKGYTSHPSWHGTLILSDRFMNESNSEVVNSRQNWFGADRVHQVMVDLMHQGTELHITSRSVVTAKRFGPHAVTDVLPYRSLFPTVNLRLTKCALSEEELLGEPHSEL